MPPTLTHVLLESVELVDHEVAVAVDAAVDELLAADGGARLVRSHLVGGGVQRRPELLRLLSLTHATQGNVTGRLEDPPPQPKKTRLS